MTSLASNLRNSLERVVVDARDIAESGARAAIEALAVHHHEPYGHMSPEERALRTRLRAHSRQLGDRKDLKTGVQKIDQLINECAYEHWHRMLFARFLAESHLLIEPESGVAISLEECEEIAKEEGVDSWALASQYAQQMLPQIFRVDNPLLQLTFSREYRLKLEKLLDSLDSTVFTASDSLGWVYQFWQSKKKEEVNKAETKIGADELPAVTQLFTEPYMVSFLLDNALGAWWAGKRLTEDDFRNATSEYELRNKAAIRGVPLEYLRFVELDDGSWTPASGTFELWPDSLCELKTLDPCCGSGHFLVAAFLMLVPMRMELEQLTAQEAVNAVLRENIHGLELDPRCVELAAFALAFAAWRYPNTGGYRLLPELQLACSGLSVSVAKEEWKQLGLGKKNLALALDWMHDQFKDAPVLGSLLNPGKTDAAKLVQWEELSSAMEQAMMQEQDVEQHEAAVVAKGLAKSAILLAKHYHMIFTNVPYLARGKQNGRLQDHCEKYYPEAKNDLATVFLDRCLELCVNGGTCSIVLPQNWLFLTSYKKFREKLLKGDTWHLIARLGAQAFQTPMWDFNVQLINLSRGGGTNESGGLFSGNSRGNTIQGLDVSGSRTAEGKANLLINSALKRIIQVKQLENPDARISLEDSEQQELLVTVADGVKGISTSDDPVFVRYFWERVAFDKNWEPYQSTTDKTSEWDGLSRTIRFEQGRGMMRALAQSQDRDRRMDMRGQYILGKNGVAVSSMGSLPVSLYSGCRFDANVSMIIPKNSNDLPAIWCFCSSQEYYDSVRQIDQSLKVTNLTLVKIPFDLSHWKKVAKEKYPNGLPSPYSNEPNQWIFHGHPAKSPDSLHVAVARLLGYRWPAELDDSMELADEQREWVKQCEALASFADDDGIVCLSAVRKEDAAADRLSQFLSAAFGSDWSPSKEREVVLATGSKSKDLDDWLRTDFFEQHCKLFGHRPFIWHIWDGRKRDGFHALVNYHKLAEGNGKGRKLLETLTYSYLGDWIIAQRDGVKQGVGGAEERLAAALELEKRLKAILEGEPPCDIFVRWKPIEEQPIGWEPDINDGVRLNIRPFMADDIPGGKKGAGILRWAPNIKWDKDRGKDVESAPWYKQFKGERINDHPLTNAEKREAREAAKAGKGGN